MARACAARAPARAAIEPQLVVPAPLQQVGAPDVPQH